MKVLTAGAIVPSGVQVNMVNINMVTDKHACHDHNCN